MVSLKDLFKSLTTRTVQLNGRDVTLSQLSAGDVTAVRHAFPRPEAPMGVPPGGSFNLRVPLDDDPAFLASLKRRNSKVLVVSVAISLGYQTADQEAKPTEPAAFLVWANKAHDELMTLSDAALGTLLEAYIDLDKGDALSFSLAPQAIEPAGAEATAPSPTNTP